jgi:GAF domain-containing protein
MSGEGLTREQLLAHIETLNAELLTLQEKLLESRDQADWTADAVKARTRLLNERVKELECVHHAASLLRDPDLGPEQRLARIVDLLPRALQHPAVACARAVIGGREYRTQGFRPSEWALRQPVTVKGAPVGHVEAAYLEPRPAADEGPFLREERLLLKTIAQLLGAAAELP